MSLLRTLVILTAAMFSIPAIAAAQTPAASPSPDPRAWHYSVTPYIWAPNLNGTLQFTHPALTGTGFINIGVHVGPSSYLTHLNGAALLSAEAHNGYWGILTDVIWLNLSNSTASVTTVSGPNGHVEVPINVNTSARTTGVVWTLVGELPIRQYSGMYSSFDVVGGMRYLSPTASVSWEFSGPLDIIDRTGSASRATTLVDYIAGFRGRLGLGSSQWYVPYYADLGANNSSTTWQALVGIGYHYRGGDILLANRWLNYYMDSGPLRGVQFVGPALGYRIGF